MDAKIAESSYRVKSRLPRRKAGEQFGSWWLERRRGAVKLRGHEPLDSKVYFFLHPTIPSFIIFHPPIPASPLSNERRSSVESKAILSSSSSWTNSQNPPANLWRHCGGDGVFFSTSWFSHKYVRTSSGVHLKLIENHFWLKRISRASRSGCQKLYCRYFRILIKKKKSSFKGLLH